MQGRIKWELAYAWLRAFSTTPKVMYPWVPLVENSLSATHGWLHRLKHDDRHDCYLSTVRRSIRFPLLLWFVSLLGTSASR